MFSGSGGKPFINHYLAALAYRPSKHVLWLKISLPRPADHILGQKHVRFERKCQFVCLACLKATLVDMHLLHAPAGNPSDFQTNKHHRKTKFARSLLFIGVSPEAVQNNGDNLRSPCCSKEKHQRLFVYLYIRT